MYTIISGTNRIGSHTEKIANQYQQILKAKGIDVKIFFLKNLNVLEKNPDFNKAEKEFLIPAQKFIFIMPEYNGTYPGVLKAMIDISDLKLSWWYKKALLVGISTGRAGNLRGMDHMTAILNHIKMIVHPNKLPISTIDKVMDENGTISNKSTLHAIDTQIDEFINF
ncbi:MAG TPA: NAD(P)H-dependent oxidoreductase [Chitinophagaceae bacterium]|nr:NAD(P)H-dependent oxidoreductase [Chitinophagaceae bacterium]